jgi:uncharacterized membrane protein YdfJ with MMPL/SSD domain
VLGIAGAPIEPFIPMILFAIAIMVVVFGSFVFEDDRVLTMFGLGMAVAVLLNATVIRMLLVPATMDCSEPGAGGCPRGSTGSFLA